jgi:hypothetical protein
MVPLWSLFRGEAKQRVKQCFAERTMLSFFILSRALVRRRGRCQNCHVAGSE